MLNIGQGHALRKLRDRHGEQGVGTSTKMTTGITINRFLSSFSKNRPVKLYLRANTVRSALYRIVSNND